MNYIPLITRIVSFFTVLFLLSSTENVFPQNHSTYFASNSAVQYGYSIKIQAELAKEIQNSNFRVAFAGGIGAFLGENWLYPTLHSDVIVFRGGIGSSWPGDGGKKRINVEINLAYTLTAGAQNRMKKDYYLKPGTRNYPFYYFSNFSLPPLQNPYNWSASWGGNIIFTPTKILDKFQQVGFLNVHLDRFQFSYSNDGPPFFPPFGDRFDRFHTGGGFVSLHGDSKWPVNLIEVGYNKFTGYSRNAYELSNALGTGYIYYKDQKQQFFNKSQFYINIANTAKNYGASINFYNYPGLDIQHKIHLNSLYPLHMVPYKSYTTIGGLLYYNQSKIGLQ